MIHKINNSKLNRMNQEIVLVPRVQFRQISSLEISDINSLGRDLIEPQDSFGRVSNLLQDCHDDGMRMEWESYFGRNPTPRIPRCHSTLGIPLHTLTGQPQPRSSFVWVRSSQFPSFYLIKTHLFFQVFMQIVSPSSTQCQQYLMWCQVLFGYPCSWSYLF